MAEKKDSTDKKSNGAAKPALQQTKAKDLKSVKEIKAPAEVKEITEVKKEALSAPMGNFVYIGKKGAMAYVLAAMTQFEAGLPEVIIKARGKSISRAVDVAEILRNREPTIKLANISIATEDVITQDGRPLKVSSIEIIMDRK